MLAVGGVGGSGGVAGSKRCWGRFERIECDGSCVGVGGEAAVRRRCRGGVAAAWLW
jgi:hypothetical protein